MKKLILVMMTLLAVTIGMQAQTFVNGTQIGGLGQDNSYGVALDNQGNSYVVGRFRGDVDVNPNGTPYVLSETHPNLSSNSKFNGYVAKYDENDLLVWAFSLDDLATDSYSLAFDITVDEMGHFFITGYFGHAVDFDPGAAVSSPTPSGQSTFVAAYSDLGSSPQLLWAKAGPIAGAGQAITYDDNNANVLVTGYSLGKLFIGSYSITNGATIWSHTLGTGRGKGIVADANNGVFYVAGRVDGGDYDPHNVHTLNTNGGTDIFIGQYSLNNASLNWAMNIGFMGSDWGYDVDVDGQGNLFLTGFFSGWTEFNPSGVPFNGSALYGSTGNAFLAKYNGNGILQWVNRHIRYTGNAVEVDQNGDVFMTGLINGLKVGKYAGSDGATLWEFTAGGDSKFGTWYLFDNDIAVDNCGNVFVSGGGFNGTVNFDPSLSNSGEMTTPANSVPPAYGIAYDGALLHYQDDDFQLIPLVDCNALDIQTISTNSPNGCCWEFTLTNEWMDDQLLGIRIDNLSGADIESISTIGNWTYNSSTTPVEIYPDDPHINMGHHEGQFTICFEHVTDLITLEASWLIEDNCDATVVPVCELTLQDSCLNIQTDNCLDFDGVNDQVTLPNPVPGNPDFTFETWMRSDNPNPSGVFYRLAGWCTPNTRLEIGEKYGKLVILDWPTVGHWRYTNQNINDGNWHHFAFTKDGTDVIVYLDGVSVLTYTTGVYNFGSSLRLGNWCANPTYENWKGQIDEVRIWDFPKSAAQILDEMNCGLSGLEPGLVAYYPFDQGIAAENNQGVTTLTDHSPNLGHGTVENFALNGPTSNWVLSGALTCPAPRPGNNDPGSQVAELSPAAAGIQSSGPASTYTLYPNPVQDLLQVKCDTPIQESKQLRLFDMQGRMVYTEMIEPGTAATTINMSTYVPGIYLMRIDGEEGSHFQEKVVKY